VINRWVRNRDLEKELNSPEREDKDRRSGEDRRHGSDRRAFEDPEITGLDFEKGLQMFGGDDESYLNVLKSYTHNTPSLLDDLIRTCTSESLSDYAIIVHGVKSSSSSIGAGFIGAQAEKLEKHAKESDFVYVKENNEAFVESARILITDIAAAIQNSIDEQKPVKSAPDADVLSDLLNSCREYDIDGVDAAMAKLESFEYESGAELISWLREKIAGAEFDAIKERLSAEL
jgi:HPt (histidine-containing phosphotransfer) domain-containing protein